MQQAAGLREASMRSAPRAPALTPCDVAATLASFVLLAMLLSVPVAARAGAATALPADEHRHHLAPETVRSLADYRVPRVPLVRDDGTPVMLDEEIDDGRPVVVSFVYTSCTTICPLTSMTLSELQRRLGAGRDRVHLVSISIDPEQDTPARLRDYARKFGAGAQWQHYTGTPAASIASQRAFDVYRGDKMSHAPITLVRASRDGRWVRLEGFASADQLLAELGGAATAH